MVTITGAARSTITEVAATPAVSTGSGSTTLMLLPAPRGPKEPRVFSDMKSLLDIYAEDGRVKAGYNEAFFQVRQFFKYGGTLLVKRVHNQALMASTWLRSNSFNIEDEANADLAISGAPAFGLSEDREISAQFDFTTDNGRFVVDGLPVTFSPDNNCILLSNESQYLNTVTGDELHFTASAGATLPAGITVDTPYYAILRDDVVVGTTTYKAIGLSATIEGNTPGAQIDLTTAGVGIFYMHNDSVSPEVLPNPIAGKSVLFYAANPGIWGNNVSVEINNDFEETQVDSAFKVTVYYRGTKKKSYICSRDPDALDEMGRPLFIESVMERDEYVRAYSNPDLDHELNPIEGTFLLENGSNGLAVTDGDMILAMEAIVGSNEFEPRFLCDGGWCTPAYHSALISAAEARGKDCVPVLAFPFEVDAASNYMAAMLEYKNITLASVSDTAAIYAPYIKDFDPSLNRTLTLAPSGLVAGRMANNYANTFPWQPNAGNEYGLLNVGGLSHIFTPAQENQLADNSINPISFARERGIRIWGQKTLKRSAVDTNRLNVRLTLAYMKAPLKSLLDDTLFQLIDLSGNDSTFFTLKARIDNFMETIQRDNGVYEWLLVDETTPSDIENHTMNLLLRVKFAVSLEWLNVAIEITPYGANINVGADLA